MAQSNMDGIANSNDVSNTTERHLGDKGDKGNKKMSIKKRIFNLKKGALHKELGVKEDEKIPSKDLEIKEGDSALEKKRKQFAINAKSFKK